MASSGDLRADRRYGYADAAFAERDYEAAADLARQAIEVAPGFAPAWFMLGQAEAARFAALPSGPDASALFRDAVAAFENARVLDSEDRLGAGVRLALLGAAEPGEAMSAGYVRALFDEYAGRFDRHLVRSLGYRGPDLLLGAVRRVCGRRLVDPVFADALDLGCGTGLAGEVFRPHCARLAGVDLSPAMVAKAEGKRLYDALHVGDLLDWLPTRPAASADLVLAADVLVYIGDLSVVMAEVARVLRPGGLFAFTVQDGADAGFVLGADHRFAHSERYLRAAADGVGLAAELIEPVSTRQDRGSDVPGFLAVLAR